MASRPAESEYDPFFRGYVALVTEPDVLPVLEQQPAEILRVAGGITPEQERYRYADGKWSIREVFGHLVDAERIFGYRAFCISRGDQSPFPGFDENVYVAAADSDGRSLSAIATEFGVVREANLAFLRRLDDLQLQRAGTANEVPVSVRALAYIMAGHVRHHINILRTRYGVASVR